MHEKSTAALADVDERQATLSTVWALARAVLKMRGKGQTRACRSLEAEIVEMVLQVAACSDPLV